MSHLALQAGAALLLLGEITANAQDWGCYDPKPGHPTTVEKIAFIASMSSLAVAAEVKHGVPAAAIAAMTMVESGYGWTRTAIEARNYFGWKFYSASDASGRSFYVLSCQPPEDQNNRYIVFTDAADAVDFVAGKLATLPAYRTKTAAYRRERIAGASAEQASRTWIAAIADPYNWKPAKYAKTVTRFMNDPVSPGDDVSPERNLYRLKPVAATTASASSPASPGSPSAAPASASAPSDVLGVTRAYFASKLPKRFCEQPINDFPRWQGFPVQRCAYSDNGVKAQTFMLNPSADQLARWTVTACYDAGAKEPKACAKAVSRTIIEASSGVFPVAGFIPEPASSAGGQGNRMLCFLFRDGVTVSTAQIPVAPAAANGQCVAGDANEQPVVKARKFARVASTTRQDYRNNGGQAAVGTDSDGDPGWLDVVRTLYQQAWSGDKNELVSAKAKSMRSQGVFK